MGQFRATECPLCGGGNQGRKWTCIACTEVVDLHRDLVRNLQQWRSLFEANEVSDILVGDDRVEYSLWDVQTFYEHRTILPDRQRESIQFCLYENMKERDAAVRMGIKPTNPVSIYATLGLTALLVKACAGELPGYHYDLHAREHSYV